jgi:glycosyltransferase involved in cell wall biosynthesis
MKARILVDGRMICHPPHGIGEYVNDLARSAIHSPLPFSLEFLVSPQLPQDSPVRSFRLHESTLPFLHPLEVVKLGPLVDKLGPDLFHSPSFASPGRISTPFVQTVHDLNHLHYGGWKEKVYYEVVLRSSCARARKLATVSRSSASEIETWLNWPNGTLQVIPNAVDLSQWLEVPVPGFPDPLAQNFVALGHFKAHKNFAFLKDCFRMARSENPRIKLFVIGGPGEVSEGIVHLPSLNRGQMAWVMAKASAFLWPSAYEGFGRPPLEAAYFGTQVLASDLAVHRETLAGYEAAQFIAPRRRDLWCESILSVGSKGPVKPWRPASYSLDTFLVHHKKLYESALSRD